LASLQFSVTDIFVKRQAVYLRLLQNQPYLANLASPARSQSEGHHDPVLNPDTCCQNINEVKNIFGQLKLTCKMVHLFSVLTNEISIFFSVCPSQMTINA